MEKEIHIRLIYGDDRRYGRNSLRNSCFTVVVLNILGRQMTSSDVTGAFQINS